MIEAAHMYRFSCNLLGREKAEVEIWRLGQNVRSQFLFSGKTPRAVTAASAGSRNAAIKNGVESHSST